MEWWVKKRTPESFCASENIHNLMENTAVMENTDVGDKESQSPFMWRLWTLSSLHTRMCFLVVLFLSRNTLSASPEKKNTEWADLTMKLHIFPSNSFRAREFQLGKGQIPKFPSRDEGGQLFPHKSQFLTSWNQLLLLLFCLFQKVHFRMEHSKWCAQGFNFSQSFMSV